MINWENILRCILFLDAIRGRLLAWTLPLSSNNRLVKHKSADGIDVAYSLVIFVHLGTLAICNILKNPGLGLPTPSYGKLSELNYISLDMIGQTTRNDSPEVW